MRFPSCAPPCWMSSYFDLTGQPMAPYNNCITAAERGRQTLDKCESCVYYSYDETYDDYICEMDLDEDEMVRFLTNRSAQCPYWRPGDEYRTARRQ